MKAIFYAAGPDFQRKALTNEIDNVDVAPTVSALLEIDPPKDSQGKNNRNVTAAASQ